MISSDEFCNNLCAFCMHINTIGNKNIITLIHYTANGIFTLKYILGIFLHLYIHLSVFLNYYTVFHCEITS